MRIACPNGGNSHYRNYDVTIHVIKLIREGRREFRAASLDAGLLHGLCLRQSVAKRPGSAMRRLPDRSTASE